MDNGELEAQWKAFRRTLYGGRHSPLDEDFVQRFNEFVVGHPHVLEWKDVCGTTLLNKLFWYLFSAIQAKLPLTAFQALIIQTPQVLAEKDFYGYTLLHHVYRYNPTARDIVSFFVEQNPYVAKSMNRWKVTPLHCACYKEARLPVIRALVEACPRATEMCDKRGDAPLHYACDGDAALDVIQFLSMQKPHICLHQNEYGDLPLDRANKRRRGGSLDVVQFLTTVTTAAARVLVKRFCFEGPPREILEPVAAYLHGRPVELSMVKLAALSAGELAVLFRRDDVQAEFREQI